MISGYNEKYEDDSIYDIPEYDDDGNRIIYLTPWEQEERLMKARGLIKKQKALWRGKEH